MFNTFDSKIKEEDRRSFDSALKKIEQINKKERM
jgi:hypothetical protein